MQVDKMALKLGANIEVDTFLSDLNIRPGTPDDTYDVFLVFELALRDLNRRLGRTEPMSADSPEGLAKMWDFRRPLYEHLAGTADQFWVAERDGRIVGYSRATLHDGLQELTELFVLPEEQSSGLGRELLNCAFPASVARQRTIIASPDVRAQALYMKAGVYPRFSIYYLYRQPQAARVETDLFFEPISATPTALEALATIDRALLGHQREEDHRWLLAERQGTIYLRQDRPVGYGYVGRANGPFALLEERDFPAVLAHAENERAGVSKHFGLEVPAVNETAMRYLLKAGFYIDPFIVQFLSETPFGHFEKYIVTSPPFFL
jgi:ribosomal protein S18 acetylase RimI-like enzyme